MTIESVSVMSEQGVVVAFAGPIGSRKSELSRAVADRLNWPRRSFGDYLRKVAQANSRDPGDRSILQQLGQSSVQADVDKFVSDVLAGIDWDKDRFLILDGLRHAEVRHALLIYLKPRNMDLRIVYVEISEVERQASEERRGVSLRELATYDRDLTEAQINHTIPAYADYKVAGSLPRSLAVEEIVSKLNLPALDPAPASGV